MHDDWWPCRRGETTSLNSGHQRACCTPPSWYINVENHGGVMSTGKNSWFVYQSSLAILPAESSGSGREERARGIMNLALISIFVHTCKCFLHAVKSQDRVPPALLPLRRKACCGFVSPLKIDRLCWVWTRALGSNGKHTNHFTTYATTHYACLSSFPYDLCI
jgi:hypothetical protein